MNVCSTGGEPVVKRPFNDPKYSDDEILHMMFYADSMFKTRQHGTCSSIAGLRGAIMRALGIPTRLVQTIPLIYRYGDESPNLLDDMQNEDMKKGHLVAEGNTLVCNHVYNEVFLNNHWIGLDSFVNVGAFVGAPLCVKIVSFGDWDEVDFTNTWAIDTWNSQRPYRTLELSDGYPVHESVYE